MPDQNFLPNVLGAVIALEVLKTVEKSSGKKIKKSSNEDHGPFHMDVPKFSEAFK